jgi:anionic cell wall polymer biosynthesis LytR-Cps2A-Psr (LCP) family protein
VETALRERLKNSETLANLPNLLRSLQGKVDTNLSPREALSLLAAGLDDKRPIEYGVLPLDPAKKSQAPLRQRVKTLPAEFWKEPVATPPRP